MDFAQALTALMDERHISGCELARRVYCDRSLIYRYRKGKQRPSMKLAHALDEALDAGGLLMELARPSRRSVLAGGLLAGTMLLAPETAERLAWAQRHPPQIDTASVDALTELLGAARRADDTAGSAVMIRPAMAQLASIQTLVRRAGGPVRPALLKAAQQWAQFGSWLCRNTADWSGAEALHARTIEWAAELGDATMIATALTGKSEAARYAGQVDAALALAQAAQRDTRAATGQLAFAAEYEARGHAMNGDAAAAERKQSEAQDLAATLAGRPQDQRPWSYWMTPEFFRREAGITSAHLASDPHWHARAVQLLEPATKDKAAGVWSSANDLTFLTFAHAQAGEVDQACSTGLRASAAVRAGGSVRNAEMLSQVRTDLQARCPGNPRVRELAEALA